MGKIKMLSPHVVEKIAAGEVIERPASVVKELVENSIDAEAQSIHVYFNGGGKKSIKVIDDGQGMSPEDLQLAIQSHTTSKIGKIEDLLSLHSLGFRGEALSSIASVARMSITSRQKGTDKSARLKIESGEIIDFKPAGSPPGTQIEVKDLFFNTPARYKFMKDEGREAGSILDQLTALALACPGIKIWAYHNNRPVLKTSGRGKALKTWGDIFGHQQAGKFIQMTVIEKEYTRLCGYLGPPSLAQSTTKGIFFFINGRPFYNRKLLSSLLHAYKEYLPKNRFPQALIYLEINPIHIDVNVHPAKREVNFSNLETTMGLLLDTARTTLAKSIGSYISKPKGQEHIKEEPIKKRIPYTGQKPVASKPVYSEKEELFPSNQRINIKQAIQIHGSYIIAETSEGIIIIDQHGAHERILFERLKKETQQKSGTARPLLTPMPLNLDPMAREMKEEIINYLARFNFILVDFGREDLLLREIPIHLPQGLHDSAATICNDLIQLFARDHTGKEEQELTRDTLLTIACHKALKANKKLSHLEINELILNLLATPNNTTCPHGRPIIKRLSLSELARFFGR